MRCVIPPPNRVNIIITIITKHMGLVKKGVILPSLNMSPTLKLFSTIGPSIIPRIIGAKGTSEEYHYINIKEVVIY